MSSASILAHPRIEALRNYRRELCENLGELLEEWRQIRDDVNPKLHARYDELFRTVEIDIQRRTMEEKMLGRREELFRIKLERGEKLTDHTIRLINSLVDKEFQRIQRQISEAFDQEIARKQVPSTPRNAEDLPKLYRAIVKKLHPDATATEGTDNYSKFWNNAQEAYQNKNIERLRSIYEMVCITGEDVFEDMATAEETLKREVERLEERIVAEERKLRELRQTEPYSLRDALNDPRWIAEQRRELERELSEINREIERHNAFLSSILGSDWKKYIDTPQRKEEQSFQDEFVSSSYFNKR